MQLQSPAEAKEYGCRTVPDCQSWSPDSRLRDDCERICHAKVLRAIWRMSNFAPNF